MATRSAARVAARGQTTRSGKVPQSRIDEQLTRPLSLKDRGRVSCSSIRDCGTFPLLVVWPRAATRAAERVAITFLLWLIL